MTIYATSDLHGQLDGLNPSLHDVCVIAGDIGPLKGFGPWHIHDQAKWMRKHFCGFCKKFPDIEFIIIPGNHDWAAMKQIDSENRVDNRVEFPPNVHLLIDSEVTVKGKRFYGTPWVPIINYHWAYEADSYTLMEKFEKIPDGIDVLVTHSPPYIADNNFIDVSLQHGGMTHFGSKELAEVVLRKRPKVVFSGHIHSGDHTEQNFDGVRCFNVSRIDERYEIAYEPTTVTI